MVPFMARAHDPYEIEGVDRGRGRSPEKRSFFPFLLLMTFLVGALLLSPLPFTLQRALGMTEKKEKEVTEEPVVVPEPKVIEKTVEVVREKAIPYYHPENGMSVARTSRGFDFRSGVREEQGDLATKERVRSGSYEAQYTITVHRPRASDSIDELEKTTPGLVKLLPELAEMVETARVSPFFKTLYDNKKKRIEDRADDLGRLLTKHNYYDCQTMLEMEAASGQKVFLLQGDMDVVSDGSDGDRLSSMPEKIITSSYYQPFTSYFWKKRTKRENPMVRGWRQRISNAKAEILAGTADTDRIDWLKRRITYLENGIRNMQKSSYLVAEYDPFIVMPVYIITDRKSAWGPNVGDYAAVIYEGKIYPAIVGDGGPNFKVGEASLKMAKRLNKKATPNYRPVSTLGVTYIVFPRTSGKWAQPDYELWSAEVAKYLEKIGGLGAGYELEKWEPFPQELAAGAALSQQ